MYSFDSIKNQFSVLKQNGMKHLKMFFLTQIVYFGQLNQIFFALELMSCSYF